MPSWDHMVDAANDFAFMKAMGNPDSERQARHARQRYAAVFWIPGAGVAAYLAGIYQSPVIAIVGLVAVSVVLWAYSERPRFLSRL